MAKEDNKKEKKTRRIDKNCLLINGFSDKYRHLLSNCDSVRLLDT